jgi:putative nucleotidyltransferase with HDIG domain
VIKEITLPFGKLFEIESPIFFKDKLLGTVILGINQSVLLEAQRLARYRILWLSVIILLTGLIGTLGLSFFLTRPVKELASGVEKLKEGATTKPLRIFSNDELGKLTESFNRMSELITEQQENLFKYTKDLEEAYVSSLRVLALAIDARDSYTLGHSTRVVFNALIIGEEIGLNQEELKELEIAALFHDVGKLKTPDAILLKKWSLSSKEYDEMRQHPEDGAEILGKVKSLQKYVAAVRHHHEHHDGKGYPDGLEGDRIPLFAAIIAIADTFDAMTSTRPYRRALSKDEALKELEKRAGKQFRPDLVRAFLRALENGKQPSLPSYLAKVI